MKLTKLTFKAGENKGTTPLSLDVSTVLVLVGPNNSGKSLALREIENWCSGKDVEFKLIQSVDLNFPTDLVEAEKLLRTFETKPPPHEGVNANIIWVAKPEFKQNSGQDQPFYTSVALDDLKYSVARQNNLRLRQLLSIMYTVRLDGKTRFALVDSRPSGDLQSHPQNHLWALFVNDTARERVRKLTNEAFGLHFVIDPTAMQKFRIRMSEREPDSKAEEQALDEKARNFHNKAKLIEELGDGIKTYTGLISAILSLPHSIILVDEPEAFLHPPLARRLGYNLSKIAQERNASLIVATHSSEFLVGCMNAGNNVAVVRLTYERSVATARSLAATELSTIMCDPLMRSTHVLRALFSRAAIVTESDADRAFYEEVNRRLQAEGRGVRDALFLNAQNVGTLYKIAGPLRKIGIPAVIIADLDFIRNVPGDWDNILNACQIEEAIKTQIEAQRRIIADSTTNDALKHQGLDALGPTEKKMAALLLETLATYGLFLVPTGELECWLQKVGAKGHGPNWLIDIFSKIGSMDGDTNYLTPDKDDVWRFLDSIENWIANRLLLT